LREDFDAPELPIDFQWLRTPDPNELFSLTERPGYLRLFGRESIGSVFKQSLVARRQQAKCVSAVTQVHFAPEHFQQMAGLVCYYNSTKYHYLFISRDEENGRHLRVLSAFPDQVTLDAVTAPVPLPDAGPVQLRAEFDEERLRFAYAVAPGLWLWLPNVFDASILSDEAMAPGTANFTGNFIGVSCQDLAGTGRHADFDYFIYEERDYLPDPARPL
jgi:xylan 1,4-beta-xylosidase